MYGIEISYSWGDCEDSLCGKFETKEKAFEKMCELVGREAYIQNEEFLEENTCTAHFDAANKKIDLQYHSDNTWCYYRVKEIKEDLSMKYGVHKHYRDDIELEKEFDDLKTALEYCFADDTLNRENGHALSIRKNYSDSIFEINYYGNMEINGDGVATREELKIINDFMGE